MGKKLKVTYDKIGDILYIDKVKPYADQESTELPDYVIARYNPRTGALENLEVLFFKRRLEQGKVLELPVESFELAV